MKASPPRLDRNACSKRLRNIIKALPPEWQDDARVKKLKALIQELPSPDEANLLESRLSEIDLILNDLANESQKILRAILPDVK